MLTYTIQLQDNKIQEIIKKHHLETFENRVIDLNDSLYKNIQVQVYYKRLTSRDHPLMKPLNTVGTKLYSEGLVAVITLGKNFNRLMATISEDDMLDQHILDLLGNELLQEVLFAFKEDYLRFHKEVKGLSDTYFPGSQLPLELNTDILSLLKEDIKEEVRLNEHFLMEPLKTVSFLCGEEDCVVTKKENMCGNCTSCRCPHKRKKITLSIVDGSKVTEFQVNKDENLLKVLNEQGYHIRQDCSGLKKCGKCKIKVLQPLNFPVQTFEEKLLNKKEMREGIRCACGIQLKESLTISLLEIMDDAHKSLDLISIGNEKDAFGIAVDVGTTTVEMAIVNLKNSKSIAVVKEENHQKKYGLDVISRTHWVAENKDGLKIMQNCMRRQLSQMINYLLQYTQVQEEQIQQVVLSANTIMSHFIMGLDTSKVAVSPFQPETKELQFFDGDIFGLNKTTKVWVLPVVAAFMGSDLLSGMIYTKMMDEEEISLLIDLGTNGEIVLGSKNGFVGCSTAVGPAFEGTHIQYGMSALDGAISRYEAPQTYTVIGDVKPKGICGSGLIDIVEYFLKTGLMDDTGLLSDIRDKKINVTEDIYVSQQDIRQIQMAKSAIRTGIELLIQEAQIKYEVIKNVYLTGGFGEYIQVKSAIAMGMLPSALANQAKAIHNTSLQGAIMCLLNESYREKYKELAEKVRYVELAKHPHFQDLYLKHMNF